MCVNACSIALVAALCVSASGQILKYTFPIDGSQETPPVNTPGSGTGNVTLDLSTNLLSWDITFGGLLAPVNNAHFHGAAPVGVPAGVQVDIGAISGLSSPMIGSTTISAAQAADLVAGLWYVNIHTTLHPSGEIRGQVVPAPGALALLGACGLLAARRRR